ncbi:HNH endonuclease [Comamonas sp. B21-038]|uniref:HNH endonuclease n=1 Tax=Comamonas sp. B21-038 TaxID=2918299 RepID=UPI001EFA50C8|nr:HNH endonuclease [Comamonas sp. B21-038]ULR90299.1 HNH endonuclease [Comamonas sp. B21-038]
MPDSIYCPYTDQDVERSLTNKEHIFPLSLGGSDDFCLPVSRDFNSRAGAKIDGALANDFLIAFRRRHFDARGHSKRAPSVRSKYATMGEEKRPVQIEFQGENGLRVFDPIENRILGPEETAGQPFISSFHLQRFSRIRFASKVALAAGYLLFGDWFRHNVNHAEVRALMHYNGNPEEQDFSAFKLKVVEEFLLPEEKDLQQVAVEEFLCGMVGGSCIYFVPGPVNIGVTVGVLGQFVATLNIEANTDNFPFVHPVADQNDLGHAVVIENRLVQRMSYRALAYRAHGALNRER